MKVKKVTRTGSTLKIEGDWSAAVGRALSKKRPSEGWPEKPKRAQKKRAVKSKPKR